MGLNTENAGALVGMSNPNNGRTHRVEILIGTFIQSVGKDVKVGAIVDVSDGDYRFLKPYGYCRDAGVEAEADEADEADEVEVEVDPEAGNPVSEVEAPKGKAPQGKRRG